MEHADARVVAALAEVARARKRPQAQVALAWLLQQPGVSAPIVGATKLHHLDDAVAALEIELGAEELRALSAPYVPHPVAGFG
jgi:aryl-alcohol dehydrogenase-like predicted oxidoreductase